MEIINVMTKEVKETLKTFKQKAPGSDTLTKAHLTNLPNRKIIELAEIFSTSLTIGHFPTPWKQSTMISYQNQINPPLAILIIVPFPFSISQQKY